MKKKAAKLATRGTGAGAAEETGPRFAVITPEGVPIYSRYGTRAGQLRVEPGSGLALADAIRLAQARVEPTGVARVEEDGSLTRGRLEGDGGEARFRGFGDPEPGDEADEAA